MTPKNQQVNRPQTDIDNLSMADIPKTPKYQSSKRLQWRIDQYFTRYIRDTKIRPNIAGFALFLGFKSKEDLQGYIDRPPRIGFSVLLKRALLKIEEVTLSDAQKNNVGSIFYSKAAFGYTEKNVLEIDAPPSISPEDKERLRRVADLWEKERRRELGAKVQQITSKALQS